MVDIMLNNGIKTYSGSMASFELASSVYADDITIDINPIQSGSGDPSPDNVRPISGWTGARVTRCGKNLCSAVVQDGKYWASSNDGLLGVFNSLSAGTYTVSVINKIIAKEAETIAPENRWIGIWPRNTGITGQIGIDLRTILTAEQEVVGAEFTSVKTITITDEMVGKFNVVYIYAGDDKNYATSSFKIQIELGSTATDYEPYQGETYDITFPSEAGTVYGGTLDVTTGLLTVTHGSIANYNGESLPGKWISSMDVYSAGGTPTTGARVVYELATPQTYQLTPTEVEMLLGENNVWADTGDSTVKLGFSNNMNGKLLIDNDNLVYTLKTEKTYVDKDIDLKIRLQVATIAETKTYLGIV